MGGSWIGEIHSKLCNTHIFINLSISNHRLIVILYCTTKSFAIIRVAKCRETGIRYYACSHTGILRFQPRGRIRKNMITPTSSSINCRHTCWAIWATKRIGNRSNTYINPTLPVICYGIKCCACCCTLCKKCLKRPLGIICLPICPRRNVLYCSCFVCSFWQEARIGCAV